MRLTFIAILILCASVCGAANLEWAGSVGNSGSTGEAWSVVRGAMGRSGGGVVVDHTGRIMTGGGDRVLALSRDGKLLWSTPMPQKDWMLSGSRFAISGNYLYFLAGRPVPRNGFMNLLWVPWTEVEPNLCRVEMYPGAEAQVVVPVAKLGWRSPWTTGQVGLAADPTDGAVYVGSFDKEGYNINRVQPDGSLVKQFTGPGGGNESSNPGGAQFSIDETGRWFFGFREVDKAGKEIPESKPVSVPAIPSAPSAYTGSAMLTRDYTWDMGIYGFVGRFTKQFEPAPGAVTRWNHALYFVAQIADAPDGAYYIKSNEALYLAQVVDGQLLLKRRFGSIAKATALCLLPSGYIGVGNDETNFHWYDFSDSDPAAAPVRSEAAGPSAQGYVDGETFVTYQVGDICTLDYSPGSTSLTMSSYHPEPFSDGANLATSLYGGKYPVGQICAVARLGKWVFAVDTKLNCVLRGSSDSPCNLAPLASQPTKAATITSIATLGNDVLLVATDAGINLCAIDAAGNLRVRSTYQLPADNGLFGKRVYLACSGNLVVAADSDRQRVDVLEADASLSGLTFVTQFGATDTAGADAWHLDTPTLVAASHGRIVVYDSGNQRIVKLRLRE